MSDISWSMVLKFFDWNMVVAFATCIGVLIAVYELYIAKAKRWNQSVAAILWKWQEYIHGEHNAALRFFIEEKDIKIISDIEKRKSVKVDDDHLTPILVGLADDPKIEVTKVVAFDDCCDDPYLIQHLVSEQKLLLPSYVVYKLRFLLINYLNTLEATLVAVGKNKTIQKEIDKQLTYLFDKEGKFELAHYLEISDAASDSESGNDKKKTNDAEFEFPELMKFIERQEDGIKNRSNK